MRTPPTAQDSKNIVRSESLRKKGRPSEPMHSTTVDSTKQTLVLQSTSKPSGKV